MQNSFLILDDDEVFANTLARGLGRRGYQTAVCHQGAQALALAKQQAFAFVSVDMHLQQDSGLQYLPLLRQLLPEAKILVLTGFASIATTVQAIKSGADNYLPKPANIDAILQALQTRPAPSRAEMQLELSATEQAQLAASCAQDGSADMQEDEQIDGEPQPNSTSTMSVRRLEWEHIQRVLQQHEGNVSQAARALHMHRRTLQRKLAKKPLLF